MNNKNSWLIFIGVLMGIGFSVTLLIEYFKSGDILVYHLIASILGLLLVILGGINKIYSNIKK